MAKINTVIFDLDGTLLNTLDDICDSVNYMLKEKGLPLRTLSEVRDFVGNGVKKLIERALPSKEEECVEDCLKIFSDYYDRHKNDKTRPYEGVVEMLGKLKEDGYKLAIVSNKYDAAVKELNRNVFKGYVDVALGESKSLKPKPAPDGVLEAMRLLNCTADQCVYVGDSDVDYSTAANSALAFIGVSWGFKGRDKLLSYGAKIVVDDAKQLVAAIKKL